jgi:uncharacterized membrane protein
MKKEHTELLIGQMLRWGTICATVIVMFGGAFFLGRHGFEAAYSAIFTQEATPLRSISAVWDATWMGNSTAILQWGVLCLIFLPIMRVGFCLFTFLMTKDRVYTIISLWLLFVLLGSFFIH